MLRINKFIDTFYEIALRWMLQNILVLSGNKPIPEPMLNQTYVAIWRHQATMN